MNINHTTGAMWTAATRLADAIRADWTTVTGRRWRRKPQECPTWCGGGHVCSASQGYPSGQHRSMPSQWATSYGTLVATRVAGIDRRNRIEVRAVIDLPTDEHAAGLAAQGLLTAIHLTITAIATPTPAAVIGRTPRPGLPAGTSRPAITGGAR